MWRRRKQSDFSAEIEAHIALEADRLRSEGMNEDEAQAAARRAFGNELAAQEQFYERGHSLWWDNLRKDLLYAFRTLRRNPTFTAAAVLTLALGIGANAALFTVIDAVLLRPLPYPDPGRLIMLYGRLDNGETEGPSPADFLDYRRQSHVFEYLAGFRAEPFNFTGRNRPQRVDGAVVTPDFFAAMEVQAQIGRVFSAQGDKPGSQLVVLSHSLWQRRYGGNPQILGKAIDIDGESRTIIGIMPERFQFPAGCEAWTLSRFAVPEHPLRPTVDQSNLRDTFYFDTIGRLRLGVTLAQAQAETNTIARRLKQQYGNNEEAVGSAVIRLHDDLVGTTKPALLVLLASVTLLLLIACANVANLLLARGTARQKEMAIRGALGAGKRRIVRQLLTESSLLAVTGGAVGVLFAYAALIPLRLFTPPEMLTGATLTLDLQVLAFTAAVSLGSGIVFGLFPALHSANLDINGLLKEGGRGTTGGSQTRRTRSVLVVSEIAFAMVLLIGAGLLLRSFSNLLTTKAGFDPNRVLSLELALSQAQYPTAVSRAVVVDQMLDAIRAVPGVTYAGATSRLPLNPGNSSRDMNVKGRTPSPSGNPDLDYAVVSPDYFRSLGVRLVEGRTLTDRDDTSGPPMVMINEAAARRFWPGKDPVGSQVKVDGCGDANQWCEVAGVLSDIRQHSLAQTPVPAVYIPYARNPWPTVAIVVRTQTNPLSAASPIESAIHSVDKDQPLFHVRAMRDVVSESLSSRRFRMVLLGLFAFLALTLACIGIYGVMAYSVAQRANEIGIRMALGAEPKQVLALVIGTGLKLAVAGIAAGVILSLGLTRFLANFLYGVQSTDIVTYSGTAILLFCVAALASYIPARRATTIDPVIALRAE